MTFSGRELGPAAPQHRSAGPLTQLMVPDGGRIHVMASKWVTHLFKWWMMNTIMETRHQRHMLLTKSYYTDCNG
jgi:hypothetical protein